MTKRTAPGLFAFACVCALVAAGQASASLSPRFSASSTPSAVMLNYAQSASDDPLATLTFFVPSLYLANMSNPLTTPVGTVSAKVVAADQNGATLTLSGPMTIADPAGTISYGGATTALSALSKSCAGTATSSAIWLATLSGSGQSLQLPIFVNAVQPGRPFSDFAGFTLTICSPPPDVPAGTPGRAALGAKLVAADVTISQVYTVTPGTYLWRSLTVPYTPGNGALNRAGAVEAQSEDRTPQAISLATAASKKLKKGQALVRGRVTQDGRGVAGASVKILRGKKVVATVKTASTGSYTAVLTLPSRSAEVTATTTVGSRSIACQAPSADLAPSTCAGGSIGGFTATSTKVTARAKR
jgi:hypothetical protein